MPDRVVLVSACLLGVESNYRGKAHKAWDELFRNLVPAAKAAGIVFVPVCPEQLGGLTTPRPPAELQGRAEAVLGSDARIVTAAGDDVTMQFLAGARMTGHVARILGVAGAIMSEKSPSCGVRRVYAGTFDGRLVEGSGVSTCILLRLGIPVVSHEDIVEMRKKEGDYECVQFIKRELLW